MNKITMHPLSLEIFLVSSRTQRIAVFNTYYTTLTTTTARTTLLYTTLHTLHYPTLQYTTLITPLQMQLRLHYTNYTTPQLQLQV